MTTATADEWHRGASGALNVLAVLLVGISSAAWVTTSTAFAQDLEPRAYTNTPVGVNFLLAGYAYQEGDIATDPSLPLEDAQVHVHSAVAAYARSFGVFGKSAKVDVVVPYSWLSGSATFQGQPLERIVDGFADPRLRFSVNLYGAPALTVEELTSYQQNVIVGVSIQIAAPLGQYDSARVVNIGSNRWAFKPEIGVSKAFGPLTLELAPSITIYTDNCDFLGDKTRRQDPVYSVQAHAVYRFSNALWGSLDGTYYGGGKTTIDGAENDDRKSNARLGLTFALSVTRRHSIKLYASKAVATRIGGDFDVAGIALQYRWGGGL